MAMDKVLALKNQSIPEQVELKNMRAAVEAEKTRDAFAKMSEHKKLREALEIDPEKDYKKGTIAAENQQFQDSVAKKLPFINKWLSEAVCVAANTIYLIGAVTGGGKSTTVANIIIPILEEKKRILVISNEEKRNHVYARVACRNLGLSFFKWTKNQLTKSQCEMINEECERLEEFMSVIGTDYQENPSFVCTPEGLELIFNTFSVNHDVILFDYYQNISRSINNPDPSVWMHQEKFCYFINEFKNRFPGPVFVMSQLWPTNKKNTMDFLERIKGRKMIGDVSPVHIEIRTNKDDYTSIFHIHKDRLWNCDGFQVLLGFDREHGRFVIPDEEFKRKSAEWIAARAYKVANDEEEAKKKEAIQTAEVITEHEIAEILSPAQEEEHDLNFDGID